MPDVASDLLTAFEVPKTHLAIAIEVAASRYGLSAVAEEGHTAHLVDVSFQNSHQLTAKVPCEPVEGLTIADAGAELKNGAGSGTNPA